MHNTPAMNELTERQLRQRLLAVGCDPSTIEVSDWEGPYLQTFDDGTEMLVRQRVATGSKQ